MKGVYKSTNKMLVRVDADGRVRQLGAQRNCEVTVKDEHQRPVALVEFRRQPDNEIVLRVYGPDEEELFVTVVKRGKDRRRAEKGWETKGEVEELPVAPGALGLKGKKEKKR